MMIGRKWLTIGLMVPALGFGLLFARPGAAAESGTSARALAMFDGKAGESVSWDDLLERAGSARVVVIGEEHDNASGHRFELALVEDLLDLHSGAALCLEMFGRDEQEAVDAYLAGTVGSDELAKLTQAARWGGETNWKVWYLPLIDAARDRSAAVIAANAPSRFTGLAREFGWAPLLVLSPGDQALFALPRPASTKDYFERFREVMSSAHHGAGDDKNPHHAPAWPEDQLRTYFRAQQVWDATMASSIVRAAWTRPRVVHVVGQFHSDFEGGLIRQIKARNPLLSVVTISLQPGGSASLRDEDRGRAGVVVYTEEE